MESTIFLAQIRGPLLVAVGLGFFVSRSYYVAIYRDIQKAPFAVLFFGMFGMAAGIAQVLSHNIWETLPEILVMLLGWGLLLKGIVCVVAPRLADKAGDFTLGLKIVPGVGATALLLGAYLSWFAYFA